MFDDLTRQAITHTRHCLTGCAIGEIVGMIIASSLHWHRIGRVALAIVLAFLFGYSLTYLGAKRKGMDFKEASRLALSVDTISIASMEIIDSTIEWIIPKALTVTVFTFRFWWGLALSLGVAFVVTVPVNRFVMSRGIGHSGNDHH